MRKAAVSLVVWKKRYILFVRWSTGHRQTAAVEVTDGPGQWRG